MNEDDLNALADAMLNQHTGKDITDIYEALEPFLLSLEFKALGAKVELCPVHHCDVQICLDDETRCQG